MSETLTSRPPKHEQAPPLENWDSVYTTIESLGLASEAEGRVEQLSAVTGDGLSHIATELHKVLAPDVSHEHTASAMHIESPDGSNRRKLLDPAERTALFDYGAGLIKELKLKQGSDTSEAYLKRAANIAALTVVLAHSFSDANGRTARTLAHVIREGYDGGTEHQYDLKTVGTNRPASGFRINSFVPTGEGVKMSPRELLDTAASIDIPLENTENYLDRQRQNFTTPYSD